MDMREIQKEIESYSKAAKSRLIIGATLVLAAFMALGTVEVSQAVNQQTTNLEQVVAAGTLDIDSAPSQLNFNSGQPGQETTTGDSLNNVVANDERGVLDGWELAGQLTASWEEINNSSEQIAASQTTWFPGNGVVDNITGAAGEVTTGSNDVAIDSDQILIENSGGPAAGAYQFDNGAVNLSIPIDTSTGTYVATLQLTIYAGQNNL